MEQRQYHYFISGLPELRFDETPLWTTPAKFVKKMRRELHPDGNRMADLILLRYDNENMVRHLREQKLVNKGIAIFIEDDFYRQEEIFSAVVIEEDILPPYMSDVFSQYCRPGEAFDHIECRRKLDDGYYRHVMQLGSRFVREYTRFEYDLSNMLTYLINRKSGPSQTSEGIAGNSPFTRHLHETAGKNLVKDPEFEY
ncbi:MAG TPA: DUF2764 family protein, partial [Bacteroidales bacterium]|nr:DUF2764 family protein [Bacteroidales bacterium]